MKSIVEYVKQAIDSNLLWECMGWDEKHGPTEEQLNAFKILFPQIKL